MNGGLLHEKGIIGWGDCCSGAVFAFLAAFQNWSVSTGDNKEEEMKIYLFRFFAKWRSAA
jgi:hypothetical protein